MNSRWMAFEDGPDPEVIPQDDARDHERGEGCWCEPFKDGNVLVHNSLDRREVFERPLP